MRTIKSTGLRIHLALIFLPVIVFWACSPMNQRTSQSKKSQEPPIEFSTNSDENGYELTIQFSPGKRHNHPLMAIWTEDTSGIYIQSLYVAQSIARGYFAHGDPSSGRWEPGPIRRPAALPYWGHKWGVKAEDGYYLPTENNPLPDAITGATPKAGFVLNTRTKSKEPKVFNLFMEINQSWDWNQYWHNNKYPDDANYKTSSQPAVIYMVTIDVNNPQEVYEMKPVGHSHYSGKDGNLYEDLSTLTTALEIVGELKVVLKQ
jgi:hypothetical protein